MCLRARAGGITQPLAVVLSKLTLGAWVSRSLTRLRVRRFPLLALERARAGKTKIFQGICALRRQMGRGPSGSTTTQT